MRPLRALSLFGFCAAAPVSCVIASAAGTESAFVADDSPQRVYAEHARSVVSVRIAVQRLNDRGKFENDLFAVSGFFISDNGHVLTFSETPVRGARIWVEKDGVSNLAEPIGWDPRTKIALLQLVRRHSDIDFIPIPAGDETPPIGSIVMSISSPYGLSPSPNLGMVTGYESSFAEHEFPFSYMRTNIPIGPAELGFPVLAMDSRLVGISVASVPEARSSYIVPTTALNRIVEDFTNHGHVAYGSLPLVFRESEDSARATIQVVVSEVRPGSSAARAGLQPGDVLRRIGTTPIRRIHDVRDAVFSSRPGDYLTIEVTRAGESLEWALPVEATRPGADGDSPPEAAPGSRDLSTDESRSRNSEHLPPGRDPQLRLPRDFDPGAN